MGLAKLAIGSDYEGGQEVKSQVQWAREGQIRKYESRLLNP